MAVGDAELVDLYRDVLLDYFKSPAHKGRLDCPDLSGHGVNPLCGDEIELSATKTGSTLTKIRFTGRGCVISQASAALMAEALENRSTEEAASLIESFRAMLLQRDSPPALPALLEEAKALEGVRRFPARIKCALLAWNTLKLALDSAARGAGQSEYRETE